LDLERLIERMQENLDRERFYHTMGSLEAAVVLALRFGVAPEKAALAALLHDCARRYSRADQWRLIEAWRVAVPEGARDYPPLWHSWLSAEVARRDYGLADAEIEDAIRCHATGKQGMSLVGEALFVADCIEPMRDYEEAGRLRAAARAAPHGGARRDLQGAVLQCLRVKTNHVRLSGRQVHPDALAALRFYETAVHSSQG